MHDKESHEINALDLEESKLRARREKYGLDHASIRA
jgi:hypothetical protein